MVGTEIKMQGGCDYIKNRCSGIPMFDLDEIDMQHNNYFYMVQCLSGDATTAKHKTKATVKTSMSSMSISEMYTLCEYDLDDRYYNIYYILAKT